MATETASRAYCAIAAYHEAGHVVAAFREGRRIAEVSIEPELPGVGSTLRDEAELIDPYAHAVNAGMARASWRNRLAIARSDIRTLLAGPLAEARYLRKPLRADGSCGDLDACHDLAIWLGDEYQRLGGRHNLPPFEPVDFLNQERARMRRWVGRARNWGLIVPIARELLLRARLGEAEVMTIIEACHERAEQPALPLYQPTPVLIHEPEPELEPEREPSSELVEEGSASNPVVIPLPVVMGLSIRPTRLAANDAEVEPAQGVEEGMSGGTPAEPKPWVPATEEEARRRGRVILLDWERGLWDALRIPMLVMSVAMLWLLVASWLF